MLVRPLPGVGRDDLLTQLRRLHSEVGNARSRNPREVSGTFSAYNSWANDAVRMLRRRVSEADIDRLVLTRRYWLLQSLEAISGAGAAEPRLSLLLAEMDERNADFGDAVQSLSDQIKRWSRPGVFVVLDTSVCYKADKLEDWDVGGFLGTRHDPVHLLFPMVVIDELDRLKESSDKHKRWRAGYTLAVLDRVLSHGAVGQLRPEDFTLLQTGGIPRGEVTVEIVLDPPGHARLPIEDDEIVDRAIAIQSIAAREVTLITDDTGQSHRARNVGLKVKKLVKLQDADAEPRRG